MLRSLLLALVVAASACAGGRLEVLSRTPVERQTGDHACQPETLSAEVELAWPDITFRFFRSSRCQRVAIDRWEIRQRPATSTLARVATGLTGAVVGAGGTYLIATHSGAFQPASLSNPAGIGFLGSVAGIAIAIGGSLVGGLAGEGLLAVYEKLSSSTVVEEAPTHLGEIERDRRPVDGVFQGFSSQAARVVLHGADVLRLDPGALQLGDAPLGLDPRQREALLTAQACARCLLPPPTPATLNRAQLASAYRDARNCFEGGVAAAEPIYSRLLAERARRSPPPVLSAP